LLPYLSWALSLAVPQTVAPFVCLKKSFCLSGIIPAQLGFEMRTGFILMGHEHSSRQKSHLKRIPWIELYQSQRAAFQESCRWTSILFGRIAGNLQHSAAK
jgi:hypothetical protein